MTMKKKVLTTLSVVLILGLAALGILAYLTDTASDVNTMTLGNVSIEQNEYQRVETANGYATGTVDEQTSYLLEDFVQDKPLLPIVGDPSTGAAGWDTIPVRMSQVDSHGGMDVFAGKNAQDKFVVVENTGKTDAYVRTLVAIEVGSTDGSLIGTSYHKNWNKNVIGKVTIDGNNYNVFEYVYKGADGVRHEGGILPAGEAAYPNLSQVYIKSVATNEDCAKIDGNGNGMLDILVLSQAVQAEGFENAQTALDTAFGTAAEKAADWFYEVLGYVSVSDSEELAEAIEKGEDVVLTDSMELTGSGLATLKIESGEEVTIDLESNSLTASESSSDDPWISVSGENTVLNIVGTSESKVDDVMIMVENGATVNVENTTLETSDNAIGIKGGTINLENTNINVAESSQKAAVVVNTSSGSDIVFNMNGGTITAKNTGISVNKFTKNMKINLNAGKIIAEVLGVDLRGTGTYEVNISSAFMIEAQNDVKWSGSSGSATLNGAAMTKNTHYNQW